MQYVLDMGCGTGIWTINFGKFAIWVATYTLLMVLPADKYPQATIIGTDLSPVQPEWQVTINLLHLKI